ncbi:pre-mRNA-splicing factor SLU7 [Auricularia subglabra TFB-10046 SS5]|nr:pre-mRNA-splicing factor SLU7 [Auricularia subglabra TFB-10046 SS5]
MATNAVGKISREEFRRQKDLDAARKAGTAPAEVDQQGRAINPHIPQYIAKAPWYLETGGPSLDHQRRPMYDSSSSKLDEWYARGERAGPAAKKYRKGACENCGAISHKTKECIERPRRRGAKLTGKGIAADEIVRDINMGYDAKRDRWNGYDAGEHSKIYEQYAAVEAARQKLREEEIDAQTTTDLAAVRKVAKAKTAGDAEFGSSDEEDEDEDKYADAADAVGQKMDTKTRITVRNLRIREDTAKYLMNLDEDSAYYDPKTRSMRDAPDKSVPIEDARFAGENFLRQTGEAMDVQKLQLFAWQSAARGNDVHLNANPTQGEILHHQFLQKKDTFKNTNKVGILDKYGGEEYLRTAPKELLTGQTENYVEYSRTGQIIRGAERAKAKSKYPEDVLVNNHTAVWGSWYDKSTGKWGYACCHSSIHVSYCAGEAGIEAAQASDAVNLLRADAQREDQPEASTSGSASAPKAYEFAKPLPPKKRVGDGDVELDKSRLEAALRDERKRRQRGDEDEGDGRDKRRKYNSFQGGQDVTEEEMEAYRMTKVSSEDPMANYRDEEDL